MSETSIAAPVRAAGARRIVRSGAAHVSLRTVAHRYVIRTMDRLVRPPQPTHCVGLRTLRIGPEPIRVLCFGDSHAIGYGVTSREESNDRFLCDALAEATGRGVVLENRGVPYVGVGESVDSLGATGTLTFHVAVWCPSFVEGVERLRQRGWREELRRMIVRLREDHDIPIVLCRMPLPCGPHYAVPMLRWGWRRINRSIELVASEFLRVHVADVDDVLLPLSGVPVVDVGTYRSNSRAMVPAVLRAVGLSGQPAGVMTASRTRA